MNYCGIILAKENSKRLPHKNFKELNGKRVFEHSRDLLINTIGVDNTFVFSDKFGNRPPAACLDEEPLFSALKWAYKSLPKRYDNIICIMANCPQHTEEGLKMAIKRFEEFQVKELRSFNSDGSESGILIFKEEYLLNKHEISTYQGSIILDSIEIHNQKDLDKCKQK